MAKVTGENWNGEVVYLVFSLHSGWHISISIAFYRFKTFFLILQGHDYCRKAQKDNKKYNIKVKV